MCRSSETVVIYFARHASVDPKKNRFSKKGVHARLIPFLHRHTQRTLRASNLPIIHSSEENQFGCDLAERLTHAFSQAFAKGYKNVIAVGNDTPDLNVARLHKASTILSAGSSVLGPSTDGGNYLIGIAKDQFDAATFCRALKDANSTHLQLGMMLRNHVELDTLTDIDDEKSLDAWLRLSVSNHRESLLKKEVEQVCASPSLKFESSETLSENVVPRLLQDRGPPVAA